jgi:hypothetical protein
MNGPIALHRDQMKTIPFTPVAGIVSTDYAARQAHAVEYIAFYLGEINDNLAKLTGQVANSANAGTNIVFAIQGLQTVLKGDK